MSQDLNSAKVQFKYRTLRRKREEMGTYEYQIGVTQHRCIT